MAAQPTSDRDPAEDYEVIHLGGETAAIVPIFDLHRMQAVQRRATAEALEEAEMDATLREHDEWVAAGRPGAMSHEAVMAILLGGEQ